MRKSTIILLIIIVALAGLLAIDYVADSDNSNTPKINISSDNNAVVTTGTTLDLSSQGLTEVPKDVLNDKSITVLNVSGNNLTGALPAEIRQLTNLEILIASDNNLTGIPAEIGQLKNLKQALFKNNDISGLPLEIGNLDKLETLDLTGNPNVSTYDIGLIQKQIPNARIATDYSQ